MAWGAGDSRHQGFNFLKCRMVVGICFNGSDARTFTSSSIEILLKRDLPADQSCDRYVSSWISGYHLILEMTYSVYYRIQTFFYVFKRQLLINVILIALN